MHSERAHPFTSFSNHDDNDQSWDIGIILAVQEDYKQWFPAWTRQASNYRDNAKSNENFMLTYVGFSFLLNVSN